ncbi:uncharacterized protein ACNS7B_016794 [Menidia menidia]
MEMLALLLVSALALLPGPSGAGPTPHNPLESVIDTTKKLKETYKQEHFVEDVQPLADAGCMEEFFCKAGAILKNHSISFSSTEDEKRLAREIHVYTKKFERNCDDILKNVKVSHMKKPLSAFLELVLVCSQSNYMHRKGL